MSEEPKQIFVEFDDAPGGVLTARLAGPTLSERDGGVVATAVREQVTDRGDGVRRVLLECERIEFMDSSGLGAVITINNESKRAGVKLVVHGLRPEIRSVFKMTKLDRMLAIADDEKKLAKLLK